MYEPLELQRRMLEMAQGRRTDRPSKLWGIYRDGHHIGTVSEVHLLIGPDLPLAPTRQVVEKKIATQREKYVHDLSKRNPHNKRKRRCRAHIKAYKPVELPFSKTFRTNLYAKKFNIRFGGLPRFEPWAHVGLDLLPHREAVKKALAPFGMTVSGDF